MNSSQTIDRRDCAGLDNAFRRACVNSCRRILAQIAKAKAAVLAEARATLRVRDKLLRLAVNEAEALASQTPYPHLLFPALAAEKVQAVAAWETRQRQIIGDPDIVAGKPRQLDELIAPA